MKSITILFLRFYQWILSPLFPAACRFSPSCSHYAMEAFENHPWHKAFLLTFIRLSKCHPYHPGGFDPVPKSQYKS